MPGRISRPSTQSSSGAKGPKSKSRKRTLDAFAIASHTTQEKRKTPRHRLGELVDDEPKNKRRRDDDEDEDDLDEAEPPKRQKRRGPDEDGDVEHGSDSEGNEWTLGGLAEDDDDSDLDSDEAFGESDEEKFEGFTFRGSSSNKPMKKKQKKVMDDDGDIDLDEEGSADEEEEEDDFGEEGVDLATMLDDDDDEVLGGQDIGMGEDSGSEEDDEDSEDESAEESESDGEEAGDEERIARLRDRLEGMDEQENTALPPELDTGLSVDDLLADLDPAAKAQYSAALKTKKKSAKPTVLTAPLPKRQQDKLDREIATQKAKEKLDRWRDTVIHNRRAEHLSFPLVDPDKPVPQGKDEFLPTSKAQNELEANIQKIMEESGIAAKPGHAADEDAEDALLKAEELATNKLPVEEVMRRRAELRRARELLFREETKAKRIAKIKSKSYRRVHRKERERQEKKERELLDPEGLGLPMDENERDRLDRKRAEERMSTKHRESKWAKSVKASNRTVWDEGARDSVHEQARRQEELKRRIAGQDVHDDDATDVSSDGEFDNDEDDEATVNRLGRLEEQDGKEKGLAGMKFMKAADAKRKAQNDEEVERMRREITGEDSDAASSGDEIKDQGLGRAIFGPKGKEIGKTVRSKRLELEEGDRSDEDGDQVDEQDISVVLEKPKSHKPGIIPAKASGPLAKGARKPDEKEEPGQELSWLAGPGAKKSKKDRQRDRATDNDTLIVTQIDSDKEKSKSTPKAKENAPSTAAGATDGWMKVAYKNDDDDEHHSSDEEPSNPILSAAEQKASYYARAFAGDDVQLQFDAEKEAAIASEDEKEVSNHLPGWGSWTGDGLSKSIRKSNAKQKWNPLWKTKLPGGVKAENRQDKNLRNVMISEKQDRKGKKYLAPVLPHEFEKKEQYERSLRVPVGPEWTTKDTFQRNTKPRVIVKQGIVAPMEKPLM